MTHDEEQLVIQRVRLLQIIAGSLIFGLFSAAGLLVFLGVTKGAPQAQGENLAILSIIAGVFLWMAIVGVVLLPAQIQKKLLGQIAKGTWPPPQFTQNPQALATDLAKLLALRQTITIIVLALLEGTGFFSVLAFFVEGQPWVLSVTGLALLVMLANFPRTDAVQTWVQQQLEQLDNLRQGY